MKTYLVMIGRTDNAWLNAGVEEYYKRIARYAPFEPIVIQDIRRGASMPEKVLKDKEGALILKQLSGGDILVLLDEKGRQMSSREFSVFVQKQMLAGIRRLFFIIGGAYGFSDAVYQRADYQISLSKMTYSHQMVRLIFAEQLYRPILF
ncbi:23S rRNA (pseudouridine(1915)-N(3))-methyltransferase RlmH [Geofilum rubicundum]|uniref:Ribosomal RNA large subunit methyltransferase H n=1 Tax=Geofilum rubicundum JCM 15548 TaxID=1236989 RepID=A0A0E9M0F1_9BACT|nr:23S rRNA (pseudouridine(1915)-N(3))-methyltransferase RlmH [Geofilum rubicundum]GAO30964.1 LSU methyltransferase RlmH [Geofilum rubicundum JCM 15548]